MVTTVCNALINTGASRCCISEKYYRIVKNCQNNCQKSIYYKNVIVRSATGSNLAPIGLVNCTFMFGDTTFNCDFIVQNISLGPLYWEEIF